MNLSLYPFWQAASEFNQPIVSGFWSAHIFLMETLSTIEKRDSYNH